MESRTYLQCPRCGTENTRASQTCVHCGYELHARADVVGVCPKCRVPVRATQIHCFNCGRMLDESLRPERVVLTPNERRLLQREQAVTTQAARVFGASLSNLPAWLRVIGLLTMFAGGLRTYLAGAALRASNEPLLGMHLTGALLVWAVVTLAGLALLVLSAVISRPD